MIVTEQRQPSRLGALSDGVFAFAATLLVVSLEVPDTFQELAHDLAGFGALTPAEAHEAAMWWRHYLLFVLVGAISATLALTGIGLAIGAPGGSTR